MLTIKCILRWFRKWGIKMDSEKKQRVQRSEDIGDTLVTEFLPLERNIKKEKKTVTILEQTDCAYVEDLTQKILDYVEDNFK